MVGKRKKIKCKVWWMQKGMYSAQLINKEVYKEKLSISLL